MQVLIVEHNPDLGAVWARFLGREGATCTLAETAAEARAALRQSSFEALVLDMELPEGDALEVADFAAYRDPELPVIAVTARGFFSDSTILELVPNARGVLASPARLDDMAALVEHYGGRRSTETRARAASSG